MLHCMYGFKGSSSNTLREYGSTQGIQHQEIFFDPCTLTSPNAEYFLQTCQSSIWMSSKTCHMLSFKSKMMVNYLNTVHIYNITQHASGETSAVVYVR